MLRVPIPTYAHLGLLKLKHHTCHGIPLSLNVYGLGLCECGTVGAGEFDIYKANWKSRNLCRSWWCSMDLKSTLGSLCCYLDAKLLLPWESSVFAIKALNCLDEVPHVMENNLFEVSWLELLITSTRTFTATCRLVLDQTSQVDT